MIMQIKSGSGDNNFYIGNLGTRAKADHFLISYKKIRVVYICILYTNRDILIRAYKIKNYCSYDVYIKKFSSLRRYVKYIKYIFIKRKSLVLIHVLVYLGLLDIY